MLLASYLIVLYMRVLSNSMTIPCISHVWQVVGTTVNGRPHVRTWIAPRHPSDPCSCAVWHTCSKESIFFILSTLHDFTWMCDRWHSFDIDSNSWRRHCFIILLSLLETISKR